MIFANPERSPVIRHPHGRKIDVLTSHKKSGELIPQYFRVEDDYCERFTFQLSAISSFKERPGVMIFECLYLAYGRKNVIILNYDINNHIWVIG
jgi:hypothetical protein